METNELINRAAGFVSLAQGREAAGFPDQALSHLVELREFLDGQTELEAGGAIDEPTKGQQPQ